MAQEISGKSLISIENAVKLFTLFLMCYTLMQKQKEDTTQLKNDLIAAINGYKADNKLLELRISNLEVSRKDDSRKIDFVFSKVLALVPERAAIKKVKDNDED